MFLYPPRPEKAISPGMIDYYESRGYIAQKKKNGTCTIVSVDGDRNVSWYTRHGEAHKAWTPTKELTSFFSNLPDSIFVGELLHSKGGGVKDTLCLFDVLHYQGNSCVGKNLHKRRVILNYLGWAMPPTLSLLENYTNNLRSLFESLTDPLDEGIVLKNPLAPLRDCHRDKLNSDWQVKCRRATKNFGF